MVLYSNEKFLTVLEAVPAEGVGWEVEVVAPEDFATVVARVFRFEALSGSKARNDFGDGSLTLAVSDRVLSDSLSGGYGGGILDREYLYRMYEDGILRHEFFGEDVEEGVLSPEGEQSVVISGRTIEKVLGWGVHVPEYKEVQVYRVGVETTSGYYTLRYGSDVTGPIAWNATAEQVRVALEGVPGIGPGNVAVERRADVDEHDVPQGTLYIVDFVGIFLDWNVVASVLSVAENTLRDEVEDALPVWDGLTNTPTLKNADRPEEGDDPMTYRVTVPGTVNFGTKKKPAKITYAVDDHVEWDSNARKWSKVLAKDVPRPSVGIEDTSSVDAYGYSLGKPAAQALLAALGRIQGRGVLPFISCLFDGERDSYGAVWSDVTDVEFSQGEDFLSLLQRLAELRGWEFRLLPGFRLMVVQGGFGVHVEDKVIFWAGGNQIAQTRQRTSRELVTRVYGQGEDNTMASAEGSSTASPHLREMWVDASGVGSISEVQEVATKTKDKNIEQIVRRTLSVPYQHATSRVFVDFNVCDYVSVEDERYRRRTEQLVGLAWAVTSDGHVDLELVLNE